MKLVANKRISLHCCGLFQCLVFDNLSG